MCCSILLAAAWDGLHKANAGPKCSHCMRCSRYTTTLCVDGTCRSILLSLSLKMVLGSFGIRTLVTSAWGCPRLCTEVSVADVQHIDVNVTRLSWTLCYSCRILTYFRMARLKHFAFSIGQGEIPVTPGRKEQPPIAMACKFPLTAVLYVHGGMVLYE